MRASSRPKCLRSSVERRSMPTSSSHMPFVRRASTASGVPTWRRSASTWCFGWPLEKILAEQLATYTRYATCPVTDLRQAGFEVLATGRRPYADVVLPSLTIVEAAGLSELFADHEDRKPYKQRR